MKTPSILQFSISKRPEWTQNYVQEPFKKHPRAELGHWYFYYQYQNDQSEFGGGMDAIAQQQGEFFPEAYLQRLGQCIRKLNKFMRPKPKSKYSSSTPKKHKKHYVKRGSTVPFIIRTMFFFFLFPATQLKCNPSGRMTLQKQIALYLVWEVLMVPSAPWFPQCCRLCERLWEWLFRYSSCPQFGGPFSQTIEEIKEF